MSGAESEAVIDRLADKRRELGATDFAAYTFLALGILAHHQPAVVAFILDRTDERLTPTETRESAGSETDHG